MDYKVPKPRMAKLGQGVEVRAHCRMTYFQKIISDLSIILNQSYVSRLDPSLIKAKAVSDSGINLSARDKSGLSPFACAMTFKNNTAAR